jgi:YD repeat-containing protein
MTYDTNGKLTAKCMALDNTRDYNNHLAEVDTGAATWTYAYDRAGQQATSSDGTATKHCPSV